MKLSSIYFWLSKKSAQDKLLSKQRIQTDTNILSLGFKDLLEREKKLQMGDPVFCKSCKIVLNKFSKLLTMEEYVK